MPPSCWKLATGSPRSRTAQACRLPPQPPAAAAPATAMRRRQIGPVLSAPQCPDPSWAEAGGGSGIRTTDAAQPSARRGRHWLRQGNTWLRCQLRIASCSGKRTLATAAAVAAADAGTFPSGLRQMIVAKWMETQQSSWDETRETRTTHERAGEPDCGQPVARGALQEQPAASEDMRNRLLLTLRTCMCFMLRPFAQGLRQFGRVLRGVRWFGAALGRDPNCRVLTTMLQ